MRSAACIPIFAILVLVSSARAALVTIPLPELLGPYPVDSRVAWRTTAITLGGPVSVVRGAWFSMSGTAGVGELICDEGPVPWRMEFMAYMIDDFGNCWYVDRIGPGTPGPIVWDKIPFGTSQFHPATWSFLLDGEGEISLSGAGSGYLLGCGPSSPAPTGEIQGATLVLDVDHAVPAQGGTWGRVKALYR